MRKTTNDEQEIRRWATRYNAHPVERAPFIHDGEPALLGFTLGEVPPAQDSLRPLAWSQFFAIFHLMGLVLVYDGEGDYELLKIKEQASSDVGRNTAQA